MLLLLISTCFCVFGNTFGYFNLFANLVMFGFVLVLVRFNFFLALPVLFLARLVEMNIVALLFGYFFAHFMGDLFAVGHSVLTAFLLWHVVAFGYIDIVAFFFRHLFGNFDVVAFFFRHLFILGNINVFARLVRDFLAFLFIVVAWLALFSVSSVTFLFLFIGGFGFVGCGTLLFLVVFGFVDGFTLLFLFIGAFLFVGGLTMLLLFVFTLFCVSRMALIFIMSLAFLLLFGLTCFGVVITAVTLLEQVKKERCWSSLRCSFNVACSHKAYKKEDLNLHGY